MTITHRHSARKGDTYRVSVYDPLTQRMKWVGTFYDEMQAKQAELDEMKRVRSGLHPVATKNPKLPEIIEKWLEYTKNERTREDYERASRFFLEYFGERRIRTLTTEDFHRFTMFMRSKVKKDGKPYSPRVIRKTVTQFYQLTNLAVELDYLERSPAPKMKRLPLPEAPVPRKVRLTAQQAKTLVDAAPDAWKDLFVVALVTGARRGELFSATYGAISWEHKTIQVRDRSPDGSSNAVKSQAAVRTIPLPDGVLELLRERMSASGSDDEDLIFTNSIGGKVSYQNFYRRIWRPTVESAGLKGLHLHDLRKAFATQLAASGHTPSFIEDVMGHKSYSTTMKYYTMTSDDEAERARRELGEWLGREESGGFECAA